MADRQTQMKIANFVTRKNMMQDRMRKNQEKIDAIQEDNDKLQEDIDKIDITIDKINVRAERDAENDRVDEPLGQEVEEDADAATTTASLDAASTSTGGDFGGWRFYNKLSDTLKRRKKKKKVYEYMDHVFGSDIGEDE